MSEAMNALWMGTRPLVLASKSTARGALLAGAGLPFEVQVADIDERTIEEELRRTGAGAVQVALRLAGEKALSIGRNLDNRIIIGADQTLALDDEPFHKPKDRAAAKAQLARLAGRTHELHSAVVVAEGDRALFEIVATARLTMRRLDEPTLDAYLDAAGDAVLSSVGAYQLEGLGIHLFDKVEGEHSVILGLPLLPLLAFLRQRGLLK